MSYATLDWVFLLDSLSEARGTDIKLRILDTVVFDTFNTMRPLFWIYTSDSGVLQKNNIREWTVLEIVDNILHVLSKNPNCLVFKIVNTGERTLIDNPSYDSLITKSLRVLQIYNGRTPLIQTLFTHELTKEINKITTQQDTLVEMTNPVSHRIKALSGLAMHSLNKLYKIKEIQFFYYADSEFSDPWLAGFSQITAKKRKISSKCEKRNMSMSFTRISTAKREWRSFNKGTPMIRGRQISVSNKSKYNKVEKVDIEIQNSIHPSLDEPVSLLPVNEEAYNLPCRGQFCKLESIKIPKYDKSLRCIIPFYLIQMGQKSENSPYVNSSLRKLPESLSNNKLKLLYNKIYFSKQVAVCLKCYVVYHNIIAKRIT